MGLCENCGVCVDDAEPHKCLPVMVKLERPEVIVIKEERYEDEDDDEQLSPSFEADKKPQLVSGTDTEDQAEDEPPDGPRLKCPHCSFEPRYLETLNNHLSLWHTNDDDSQGRRKRHYYRSDTFHYGHCNQPQDVVQQTKRPRLAPRQATIRQQVVQRQSPRQVILARRVVDASERDSHVKFKRFYECLHCCFKAQNDSAVKEHVLRVHSSKVNLQMNHCKRVMM